MAGTIQKIRKVQTSKVVDFDDQLWPINCAILILAGFVAGIVIAVSDFHDPRVLYNGWARLGSVGLMVGLLLWGVMLLQGKMLRRLQLCIVVSLLVHVWLAMYLHEQYLALVALREAESAQRITEPSERITVPDYYFEQIQEPEKQQSFQEPIETEAPRPTEPEAVQRDGSEPEMPTDVEPPDEPEIPQRQQPNPAVIRRAELSAPRRADAAAGGQISRQQWRHRPTPNRPIPQEEIRPPSQQAAAIPGADIAPHQRQPTEVRVDQRQAFEEVSSTRAEPVQVRMARRATGREPIADVPTTPAPTRQVRRPAEIPRTEAAAPEPIRVAQKLQEAAPGPPQAVGARRQAEAPAMVRPTAEPAPTPTAPPAVAYATGQQRRSGQPPQLAEARRPVPLQRPGRIELPTDAAAPRPEAVARPGLRELAALSSRTPSRPVASTGAAAVQVSQPPMSLPLRPGPSAIVRNPLRRAQRPTQPSLQPRAARPARLARSQQAPQIAAVQTEPAAATSPPTAPSTQPSLPTVRPMTTSVSRTADRSARASQDQPAGRALHAMTRTAQLPTALAARRATALRQGPSGADAAPSRPTSLARATGGAQVPSTAIPTEGQPAAMPAAAGGTPASRLRMAAGAAVRRAGARPMPGSGTGAAGTADFAIGSSQIVARSGQPRATGIGQPSARATASTPRIGRAAGPATSIATSGVAGVSPAASGAVASSLSGPSAPSFNLRGSAARRGGTVSEPATQTAIGSGPAGTSGTPGPVGVALSSRVTRYESISSAIAGSGTPNPGRTPGGAVSPDATAETSDMAFAAAPSGGAATQAPPLQAEVSGPRRQVKGLPGGIQSQPAAGALASLTGEGAALTGAVARRAMASGQQPGGRDISAAANVTRKTDRGGTDLPAAAVPIEQLAETGAGGVAIAQGGLPSSLPSGSSATLRRASADVAFGQTTAAPGSSESSRGTAQAVAMAGQARTSGDSVPAPAAGAATPRIRRSPATGPAIATPGPAGAEPAAEALAGGPDPQSGGSVQALAGGSTAAVARGAGGLAARQPAEAGGPPAAAVGRAVAAAPSTRTKPDDTIVAAVSAGAVAGPQRKMGALRRFGTGTAAAELAEAGPSTGGVDAALQGPLEASLAGPQRQMAGLPGSLTERILIEAATQPGPPATTPGTARGHRRLPQGSDQPGPLLAAEVGRGPLRKTDAAGLPRGLAEAIEEQPVAYAGGAQLGDAIDVAEGIGLGEPGRREGGLPVQIAALAGPGGLGYDPSPDVGLPTRRARRESEIIHTVSRRFVIERSGGQLAIDGRVREQPTEAFRQRDVGRRAQVAQARGGSEGTEKSVEMGLDFFARHQFPDGRWSLHQLPPGVQHDDPALGEMKADTAATGLALLTYLGAGYTHLDDKHRAVVNRGIDWLIRNQKPNGDLFTGGTKYAWFYSHGIATIALCEAYGMTRDPDLREPARKAIEFICKTQHPTQGGWRYFVDRKGVSTETDTSVSGWMLMALKSAQMAGLDVPEETLQKVDDWLNSAAAPKGAGQYVYNPYAKDTEEQRHGRKPNLAMTAEAMLMRMYLGYGREDAGLIAGADHLKGNLPAVGTADRPLRDCYYWYYATQAMFQMQEDYWTAWNDRLRPLAESSQVQFGEAAGSWHPGQPVPDKWGRAGGRHYVTALHILMLEVYYRHLPLFQELSR